MTERNVSCILRIDEDDVSHARVGYGYGGDPAYQRTAYTSHRGTSGRLDQHSACI